MKILVTGNRGYIGSVMVPLLIADGHEVVGLDSDLYAQCTFGEWSQNGATLQQDLRDVDISAFRGCDIPHANCRFLESEPFIGRS